MVPQTPPPTPSGATTYGGATTTTTTTRDGSSKGLVVSLLMDSMNSLRALWKKKKSQDTQNKKAKKFLSKISSKLISFKNKKNVLEEKKEEVKDQDHEDFGDGGLWQKEILMGDKCQPLDFSGVIYYDRNGRRLPELPMKSPRASPLPSYLYASSKSADQLKVIKESK